MLDPDEMAAYEAWKEHKLTSQVDLSVAAFNLEQEAQALAWDDGCRVGIETAFEQQYRAPADVLPDALPKNRYRGPGMRAARVSGNTKRISS